MKTPFPEKLTVQNKFQPSAAFKTYAEYLADYEARKLAHEEASEEDKATETEEVTSPILTLKRLSVGPNDRGSYCYQITGGLPDFLKDPKVCALLGREERTHTIFYSPVELGNTVTNGSGIIEATEFQHRVVFIKDKVETLANGKANGSFGKYRPSFPKKAVDVEKAKKLQADMRDTAKIERKLKLTDDAVLVAGSYKHMVAKESAKRKIAMLYGASAVADDEAED